MKGQIRFAIIVVFVPLLQTSKGAVNDTIALIARDSADILPLPPLDTLIVWAEANSPVLKGQDALIEKNTADTKRVKKLLLDAVKLNAGVQYGNYGDPLVNRLETGYNSGINLSFSLYQLFGWKNQVQVYNAEKKVSMFKKDELDMSIKQMITILYNDTRGRKAILKIRSDAAYSAYSHVKMAEKEFTEGSIEVGELSRVTEIYTTALVAYEQVMNDLKNSYMEIELATGVPLTNYKQQ